MKKHKPTSAGRRGMRTINFRDVLTGARPHKALTKGGKRAVGRASTGTISMRHRGGGHKRRFRAIDFTYDKHGIPARVESVEYDPNRSGFIALVCYADGERRYVLAPRGTSVGGTILTAQDAPVAAGNRTTLARVPVGTSVFNIELKPGSGAKLARSAGGSAQVIAHDAGYTHLKMPSSEIRKVPETAWASIGEVSNEEHKLVVSGKAGRSRWLGKRPTVRGSAMAAVDHPHGGGEGRQGRGHRRQRTKWGRPAGKGQKTRRTKKYSSSLIVQRRKVGKKRG